MELNIDAKGQKKQYKSTITPSIDAKALMHKFVEIVMQKNSNARPSYLDSDEDIIEHISTKTNDYKITNKNIIKFSKKGDLEYNKPLSEITVFDYYPGKMDSTFLYFESKSSEPECLNIKSSSTAVVKFAGTDPKDLAQKIYSLLIQQGKSPYPNYLNNEKSLATL